MVHMGGESWCTIKDLQAPFPDLKTGHVDHLLSYIYQRITVADPGFLKGGAREARRKIWPRPHFIY